MRRTVEMSIGDFGSEPLGEASTQDAAKIVRSLIRAIRYYLADHGSGRVGWMYPRFRRDDRSGSMIEAEIEIEDEIWEAFSHEADRQGVTTDQLAQHAILYFAADRDRRRLAQRIAEGSRGQET